MLRKEAVPLELFERIILLQKNELFKDYILAGGTALALQTGYRNSIDIDLFTFKKQDNELFLNYFRNNFKDINIDNNTPGILNLVVDNVITDICNIRGNILEAPKKEDGITMFGLSDISAMKLSTICDRKRAKDYTDIAYLLENGIRLEDMFELYKKKYDEKDIFRVKKALLEYNMVNPYEWEKVKLLDKNFLVSNVPRIIKDELEKYNKKYVFNRKKTFGFKKKEDPDYDP